MGEACQRKLAKLAGTPWQQDIPRPPEPSRYLGNDGEWHEYPPKGKRSYRRRSAGAMSVLLAVSALARNR